METRKLQLTGNQPYENIGYGKIVFQMAKNLSTKQKLFISYVLVVIAAASAAVAINSLQSEKGTADVKQPPYTQATEEGFVPPISETENKDKLTEQLVANLITPAPQASTSVPTNNNLQVSKPLNPKTESLYRNSSNAETNKNPIKRSTKDLKSLQSNATSFRELESSSQKSKSAIKQVKNKLIVSGGGKQAKKLTVNKYNSANGIIKIKR